MSCVSFLCVCFLMYLLSVENQKGIITTIQGCSVENQRGAITVYIKSMVIAPFFDIREL